MTTFNTLQAPAAAGPQPFHDMDPHAYLRLQLPVFGGQSRSLGKVDGLEHDPDTRQLTALVVQHGLLRRRRTRIAAHHVKWVNKNSVILAFTRSTFKRLPLLDSR